MNVSTLSENLARIKSATDSIRSATDTPEDVLEDVATAVNKLSEEHAEQAAEIERLEQELEEVTPVGTIDIESNGLVDVAHYVNANVKVLKRFNDVNFYDYDGSIIESYTRDEFLTLNELPANPSHEGLIAQGWNWDLTDAQDYVEAYGKIDIGQMYTTDDGATRIYISLTSSKGLTPKIASKSQGSFDIDWGDGVIESFVSTSQNVKVYEHRYQEAGDYVISIFPKTPETILNFANSNNSTYGTGLLTANDSSNSGNNNTYYNVAITKVEIGSNFPTLPEQFLSRACNCKTITIPNTVTRILRFALTAASYNTNVTCSGLVHVNIPNSIGVISGNDALFTRLASLKSISMPKSMGTGTNSNSSVFEKNYSLKRLCIPPDGSKVVGTGFCSTCYNLEEVIIPEGVEEISSTAFNACVSLKSPKFPSTLKMVGSNAFISDISITELIFPAAIENIQYASFQNIFSLKVIDLRKHHSANITWNSPFSYNRVEEILVNHRLYESCYLAFTGIGTVIPYADDDVTKMTTCVLTYTVDSSAPGTTLNPTSVHTIVTHTRNLPGENNITTSLDKSKMYFTDGVNRFELGEEVTVDGNKTYTLMYEE